MSRSNPNSLELSGHLDAFIKTKRPQPEPLATSQEIRDRGSIFIANIYRATTPEEAKARVTHLKHIVHRSKRATHEIAAWRCMVLKSDRSGLGGLDDFELVQGSKDDGESWAGGKVLKVLQNHAIIDAVVIVSRWYGGTMLGPARFTHIETCAAEVCREFKRSEELRESIATLQSLDDLLAVLRRELGARANDSASQPDNNTGFKKPDYKDLDVDKAKRLIQARERSVQSVRSLLAKNTAPTI